MFRFPGNPRCGRCSGSMRQFSQKAARGEVFGESMYLISSLGMERPGKTEGEKSLADSLRFNCSTNLNQHPWKTYSQNFWLEGLALLLFESSKKAGTKIR